MSSLYKYRALGVAPWLLGSFTWPLIKLAPRDGSSFLLLLGCATNMGRSFKRLTMMYLFHWTWA